MTQDELAGKSGLGVRSIRAIETGRVERPRSATVRVLADALGLSGIERDRFHDATGAEDEAVPSPEGPPTDRPVPAQLPPDVVGFAGREDHVRHLLDLLRDPPTASKTSTVVISAIAGTAGVGKTALAVHWGHRVRRSFPDGQLYVNLRGFGPGAVMSADRAVRILLDALGVPAERMPAQFDAQVGLYRSLLSGRRVLVLLDNARDADQVRPLLPGAPGCVVIVTSRNDLAGLVAQAGARPIRLDVLTTGEARDLLIRRLGHDRVAAEPAALTEIIDRCGRLPLALAVVAARAAGHPETPLSDVAAQLRESGLRGLAGDDAASDPGTVFGWSYLALRPGAARMFRLMGLHPGPDISLPAAASLAAAPVAEVRAWLTELTSAHLLTELQPGRYAMHDLLRVYAAELARMADSENEQQQAIRRAVDHYLRTAHPACLLLNPARPPITLPATDPRVTPEPLPDYDRALAWFTAEHAVLLAAFGLAAAHGLNVHAWQLAWAVATYLSRRGHWQEYVAIQNEALRCARHADDLDGQAQVHMQLGSAYIHTERYEEAMVQLRSALDIAVALGRRTDEAHALTGVGVALERLGRYREALDHDLRALAIYRTSDDRHGLARAMNNVAWDYVTLDQHERAVEYGEEALALFTEIGGRMGQASALNSLGNCHHHLGDHRRGVERYGQALAIARELGDRYLEADTLADLMAPLQAIGDLDAARDSGEKSLAIFQQLGHSEADTVRARLAALAAETPQ
jgi:tetratricopeptide (TPR) repeat protein